MAALRITRRDLRLASGLVLFAYVAVHLIDHALGLVSLSVAEAALSIAVAVWHSLPGTLLLYGAASIHVGLAFIAVYERRTLRMPAAQALRIVLGLGMPMMLIGHFIGTRFALERYGLDANYARVVSNLWAADGQGRQLALLAPGWLHGCLGLNLAFGTRRVYQRLRPVLFGAALLMPVLAGLGFVVMGRELAELAAQHPELGPRIAPLGPGRALAMAHLRDGLVGAYFAAVGMVFGARWLRSFVEQRRKAVLTIAYPHRTVQVPRGWTVLEASRSFGIAHMSACGGRARCSTCRVRVVSGARHCPAPNHDEQRTLDRIRAGSDVRLACQLRPEADIAVMPLLRAEPQAARGPGATQGSMEREVALLFADLRRWRSATGGPPSPHDTVYALNLVFEAVGDAVAQAGGVQGGFSSDAASAIFGLNCGFGQACTQALRAAAQIDQSLRALNARLAGELGFEADIALCLHAGPAVVAHLGYREMQSVAVVGRALHASQRLREFARGQTERFVISVPAIAGAGVAIEPFAGRTVRLEGAGPPLDAVAAEAAEIFAPQST